MNIPENYIDEIKSKFLYSSINVLDLSTKEIEDIVREEVAPYKNIVSANDLSRVFDSKHIKNIIIGRIMQIDATAKLYLVVERNGDVTSAYVKALEVILKKGERLEKKSRNSL